MRELMGTVAILDVRDELPIEDIEAVCKSTLDHLEEIEAVFSTYRPDSEINRLGRGELSEQDASPWVHEVLELCETVRAASGGAFDIRRAAENSPAVQHQGGAGVVPIEPSGMVKGWAIDRAVDVMRSGGLDNFTVNVGGDIYAAGYCDDAPWQIGLQHPSESQMIMAVMKGSEFAVATSGAYERGAHIEMLPEVVALQSITVVGPDVVLADAYATAAFAMGTAGIEWVAGQSEFEVFAVTGEGEALMSAGMEHYLVLPPELSEGAEDDNRGVLGSQEALSAHRE